MIPNCNNNEMTRKTMYNINMMAPSNLDIFHLLIAIVMTTAISIMKSRATEQKSPELLTRTASPTFIALAIIQGRGSLQNKIFINLNEWMNKNLQQPYTHSSKKEFFLIKLIFKQRSTSNFVRRKKKLFASRSRCGSVSGPFGTDTLYF